VARSDYRAVRNDPAAVQRALDRLDAGVPGRQHIDRRRHARWRYRAPELTFELPAPDGQWNAHTAWSRNISDGGLSLLCDRFVHPGTACRVHLRSRHGQPTHLPGRVVRSRYLEGTGMLHEVGLRFEQPTHAALFCREAVATRLLLVDPDPAGELLVARHGSTSGIRPTCVRTAQRAVECAERQEFDLVLAEVNLPDAGGLDLAFHLRTNGFIGPIVAISTTPAAKAGADWLQAGCNAYIRKPLTAQVLADLLERFGPDCLVSRDADQPHLAPLVNRFVARLQQQAWRLEMAFCRADTHEMLTIAGQLKDAGSAHGFDAISAAAAVLEQSLIAGLRRRTRAALDELVRWCLAAQPVPTATASTAPA